MKQLKESREVRMLKLVAHKPGIRAANIMWSPSTRSRIIAVLRAKGLLQQRTARETGHTELLHLTELGAKLAAMDGLSDGESVTKAGLWLRGATQ